MRTIEEIKNSDRVYQFEEVDYMMPGSYSFLYTFKDRKKTCTVILGTREPTDGGKYAEHASFSILGKDRPMPTWAQKCEIKDLIWEAEEECYQIFPKASQYIHSVGGLDNVMHIWKDIPAKEDIP